eukprot:Clim_evm110s172 gene=Clim_evmTU110s172
MLPKKTASMLRKNSQNPDPQEAAGLVQNEETPFTRITSASTGAPRLKLFCMTWNVAGERPCPKEDLIEVLQRNAADGCSIWVVSLQEISLDAFSTLVDSKEIELKWQDAFQEAIQSTYKGPETVQLVESCRLVGCCMFVFACTNILDVSYGICAKEAKGGTQILPSIYVNNKGGTAIRMKVGNDTYCFINVHLPAHEGQVSARNNMAKDVLDALRFKDDLRDRTISVAEHDNVIFMGDMNYRLRLQTRDDIYEMLDRNLTQDLLERDELKRNMGSVFPGFREGHINFLPTYKLKPGTTSYSTKRTPSYTDRILYRAPPEFQLIEYTSVPLLSSKSDHASVVAIFDAGPVPVERHADQQYYGSRRADRASMNLTELGYYAFGVSAVIVIIVLAKLVL